MANSTYHHCESPNHFYQKLHNESKGRARCEYLPGSSWSPKNFAAAAATFATFMVKALVGGRNGRNRRKKQLDKSKCHPIGSQMCGLEHA
jgi:hypothetical protein